MPIRCLIVDDNASFRHEMGGLLEEQGLEVVGGAASAAEALQQIAELRPDVALIDIDLGRDSGLALANLLQQVEILKWIEQPGLNDVRQASARMCFWAMQADSMACPTWSDAVGVSYAF